MRLKNGDTETRFTKAALNPLATRLAVLLVLAFLVTPTPADGIIIEESRFDVGLDGWGITDGPSDIFWAPFDPARPGTGGYVRFIDPSPTNLGQIIAPTRFLGDWSGADKGVRQLSYDMKVFQSDTSPEPPLPNAKYRVTISNETLDVSATWGGDTPQRPFPGPWVRVNVTIPENTPGPGSRWDVTGTGTWTDLLGGVTDLRIHMELFSNSAMWDERTGVDNIVLSDIPEPATLTLLALGGLAVLRKRRKQ